MNHYILVKNKTALIKCKKVLDEYDIEYEIVPSPRQLSVSCVEAIAIEESSAIIVEKLLKVHSEIKTAGIHKIEKRRLL